MIVVVNINAVGGKCYPPDFKFDNGQLESEFAEIERTCLLEASSAPSPSLCLSACKGYKEAKEFAVCDPKKSNETPLPVCEDLCRLYSSFCPSSYPSCHRLPQYRCSNGPNAPQPIKSRPTSDQLKYATTAETEYNFRFLKYVNAGNGNYYNWTKEQQFFCYTVEDNEGFPCDDWFKYSSTNITNCGEQQRFIPGCNNNKTCCDYWSTVVFPYPQKDDGWVKEFVCEDYEGNLKPCSDVPSSDLKDCFYDQEKSMECYNSISCCASDAAIFFDLPFSMSSLLPDSFNFFGTGRSRNADEMTFSLF